MKITFKKSGFTLIELLVVMVIIGILAAIVVVSVTSANSKSRDARRKSDLDVVSKALNAYAVDNFNTYPSSASSSVATKNYNFSSWWKKGLPDGKNDPCWCGNNIGPTILKTSLVGNFLPSLPLDPQDQYIEDDLSKIDNHGYIYQSLSSNGFVLGTNLENVPNASDRQGNYKITVGQ